MIRGTTPTHIFKINIDPDIIKDVHIIYAQNDEILIEKSTKDCNIEKDSICVRLSQEESLLFDCKKVVQIQIAVLTHQGDCMKSKIINVGVDKCLKGEVIE